MIPNSLLTQLKEVTTQAEGSENIQEGMNLLARAFSIFSEETSRLEQAYTKLQKRFKAVNTELEKSHRQLNEKVLQLDMVTHYLNNILRHMNQGILFIGLKGMITTYNTAAEKILGIKHTSVIFQSFWDVFSDDFFSFSMTQSLQKLSSPELSFITTLEKDLEISTTFVRKGLPSSQGIILLIRDITEMRRLQKESSRKKRLQELGEIAASVAHEIRNPLGGIQGYASLLYEDLEKDPHLKEMAGQILEGSKRLNHLVEEVLQYARPLQLHKETIDLTLLVKKTIDLVQVDRKFPKNVEIDMHIKEPLLMIALDEKLIARALLNLIFNGIEAMAHGGILKIHLSQSKDKVFLIISDTGVGIEPKNLEKIFTPYFTTKEKGNGLGLCDAYKIIEAHFGSIEVTSQMGLGTTFKMAIPLT